MTEYTAAVIRLENAYESMKLAKGRVANEIKARHRAEQRREIQEANRELEHEFATALALENANGLPGDIIRSDVLHTQDWTRWKKWRDLAGIEPERVSARKAKETQRMANAPLQFSADLLTLTVTKDSKGRELANPVVFDLTTLKRIHGKWWPESGTPQQNGISTAEREATKQDPGFLTFLHEEIQRAIDAGTIDNPEEKG